MYCFYPRVETYALTALDAVCSIGRNQREVERGMCSAVTTGVVNRDRQKSNDLATER